jgi:hypothetical protein
MCLIVDIEECLVKFKGLCFLSLNLFAQFLVCVSISAILLPAPSKTI